MFVLVTPTRRPFLKSKPGRALTRATLLFPYTPFGEMFGFQALPFYFFPLLAAIVGMYIFIAEGGKKIFYRKITF